MLDFFYEFASTYSYIAALRIAPLAESAGVTVRWRPFLLGPIFKAQGWDTSPFNLYEAKGRYMWRDMERLAAELSLPFRRPDRPAFFVSDFFQRLGTDRAGIVNDVGDRNLRSDLVRCLTRRGRIEQIDLA